MTTAYLWSGFWGLLNNINRGLLSIFAMKIKHFWDNLRRQIALLEFEIVKKCWWKSMARLSKTHTWVARGFLQHASWFLLACVLERERARWRCAPFTLLQPPCYESAMTSDGRLTSIQARNHQLASLRNHQFYLFLTSQIPLFSLFVSER